MPGGRTIEDTKAQVRTAGAGGSEQLRRERRRDGSTHLQVPTGAVAHGWITDHAAAVKSVVDVPVLTVARINDPLIAESVVSNGKADAIVMGRASLADPEFPDKAIEGRFEDIIQCTACMQGARRGCLAIAGPVYRQPADGRENEFA